MSLPYIDGMEAVNILVRIDGIEYLCFINVFGKRQLHKDTVNFRVFVIFIDKSKESRFGNVLGYIFLDRIETKLLWRFSVFL